MPRADEEGLVGFLFLGRSLRRLRGQLVLAYRGDEVPSDRSRGILLLGVLDRLEGETCSNGAR